MEYWSVEKKDINPLPIMPTLRLNNPTIIEIESSHDGLPSLGYRSEKDDPVWLLLL